MKIRALRVREVGCLREPMALEGLSGKLDVLAGPNELGKSTLFRALETAFSVLFTSKAAPIRDWMVPDGGGAPIIEVDFEIAGDTYRLRKQYFTTPKAWLTKLGDGSTARGGDAEVRLAELLAKVGGADRLGLLWVHQTGALEGFAVDGQAAGGLKGLIERELSAAAGGPMIHSIRKLVDDRLYGLVTRARQQPRGAFKEAVDRQAALAAERDDLRRKVNSSQMALDRLGALRSSHDALTDPATKVQREERIEAARKALQDARAATDKRRTAEEASKRLQHEHATAAAELANFDARAKELTTLADQLVDSRSRKACAVGELEAATERQEAGATGLAALTAAEQELRARFEGARRAEAAAAQRRALARRLADAKALSARIAELRARIAANSTHPEILAEAESAEQAIARHGAASTRVAVAYEPGGVGRISRDGAPIAADSDIEAVGPLDLVIAGIGRIRITPPGSVADAGTRISAARRRLAEILALVEAPDLATLRTLAAERAKQTAEFATASARLDGLCPDGIDRLQAEIDALAADLPTEPAAKLGADLSVLQARLKSTDTEQRANQARLRQAELAVTRLETNLASLEQRHAALAAAHPVADRRALLEAASHDAAGRAQQALLELSAHRAHEPSPEQMAALERELSAAAAADLRATQKAHAEANEMAGLEASLRRDALDGISERLAECEGALEAASKRLATLTREVAALSLLEAQFIEVAAETRARYLTPVTDRLLPYLATVLPRASLTLGGAFGPETMQRANRSEAIGRLSEGTREQIAVLVRLGLARLLSDGGEPVPLILDDALVYSDDTRIAAAFAALRMAAEHHQVIVLTCRTQAFDALGGTRLALRPWQGFAE